VTTTPWGDPRRLGEQRLRPGPGGERSDVVRNQRERLFAATVACVAERGYAATRVADVIELAGVSRSTFYRDFDSLQDCFVQTLDSIVTGAELRMAAELTADAPWDERLRAYFGALVDLVVSQPEAARLCLVDAYGAGNAAVARVDRMARSAGRRALEVLEESPERAGMPRDIAAAVLGGLRTVIQIRLCAGRERELPELVPKLMDWALGYRTPPAPLRRPRSRPAAPPAPVRDSDDPRQRIVEAIVATAARKGYSRTTVTEIAELGAMSLTTFYDCFEGKPDAFVAALDDVMRRMLETTLPAYRAAADWPHGVRDGIDALFAYLSHQPDTAAFATESVWATGPPALTHLEQGMAGFQAVLSQGLRNRPDATHVTAEAIGASILALSYDDVARRGGGRLYELVPSATFVALSPSIGAIEACAIANGR
jgi:AcrR family transcriptional regulator